MFPSFLHLWCLQGSFILRPSPSFNLAAILQVTRAELVDWEWGSCLIWLGLPTTLNGMGTTCIAISQLFRTVWAKSYWEHSNITMQADKLTMTNRMIYTKLRVIFILVSGNNYYNHRSAHTNIWTLFSDVQHSGILYNFEYFQEDQHNDNDSHQPSDQKAYATDGQFPGTLLQGKKKKKTQLLHTMYKNYLSKVDILLTKLHV